MRGRKLKGTEEDLYKKAMSPKPWELQCGMILSSWRRLAENWKLLELVMRTIWLWLVPRLKRWIYNPNVLLVSTLESTHLDIIMQILCIKCWTFELTYEPNWKTLNVISQNICYWFWLQNSFSVQFNALQLPLSSRRPSAQGTLTPEPQILCLRDANLGTTLLSPHGQDFKGLHLHFWDLGADRK